jgi:thioesterase domain-containing protein
MVGTQGLGLPFRPLARLAQNEERRCTGHEARSGGGLGEEMAVIRTQAKRVVAELRG